MHSCGLLKISQETQYIVYNGEKASPHKECGINTTHLKNIQIGIKKTH